MWVARASFTSAFSVQKKIWCHQLIIKNIRRRTGRDRKPFDRMPFSSFGKKKNECVWKYLYFFIVSGVCVRPLNSMKHESGTREIPFPPLISAGQILASHTAAILAGLPLPTLPPALYHRALMAWPCPPCPPSPASPELQMPRGHTKLNNNHIVTSSSGEEPIKKAKKRKPTIKKEPPTVASPPVAAPLSPPSSAGSPPAREPPRDKLFTCKICSRSFGYKHVLQNHERTHTGEKPFECNECHKRFTRDHHLKTHLRLHTGEKPYSCPHCPRHFVQVANLRRHLRVHTGERPYRCELCQARFSDSNQLKAHALIHNGEKPFCCERCCGRFRRRHHLLHHKCGGDVMAFSDSGSEGSAACPLVPEQTEPEDLSVGRRLSWLI